MRESLIEFYLDYMNNWMMVASMAEHYGITELQARVLIALGKEMHNSSIVPV